MAASCAMSEPSPAIGKPATFHPITPRRLCAGAIAILLRVPLNTAPETVLLRIALNTTAESMQPSCGVGSASGTTCLVASEFQVGWL
jgi:hypothetical protein